MTNRIFYDLNDTYVEPNEYGGWDWGIYNVPVNRGAWVSGRAYARWMARVLLFLAKRKAKKYGFRP